ncbi:MAG TPA: aldo/keto reductase, partial [Thermomicrobiales bacterium]|nr:aldo/keto reductase [Thermomicrobiales bacterium]
LRPFGKTGEQVSLLCVGGAHMGMCDEETGIRIVHESIQAGATFMDNAWEYNSGISEVRMGKALAMDGYRQKAFLMTKDCAHDRVASHSLVKLEDSLRRLQTDYLDLWQIHEVVWEADPDRIFAPGGSAEAMLKAKEQGKVRYIGFTGHKDPDIHRRMLSQGFPWDAVQMPINVFDAHYRSFRNEILPICQEQGIAVIGMKSFASGRVFESGSGITPSEALRYAMSQPVATVVSGIDSIEVLHQNLDIARTFTPLTAEEEADVLRRSAKFVDAGDNERHKTTDIYEGAEGRHHNDYPQKFAAAD